jgi:tRNA pseudouridine55 synthase
VEKIEPLRHEEGQVLLVNKPLGWTSFDVVRKIRNMARIPKVGHAGTLDPLATGLLIVCTGRFTKQINSYMAKEKEYTGIFTLGATTPTYDLESQPVDFRDIAGLTEEAVRSMAVRFTGNIKQVPPPHSAIKKDGKRAYELARKGVEVNLDPRPVHIALFEIPQIDWPRVHFRVVCSTGTYIRSLAHDFGRELGCGAYLSLLCRTRIGEFTLDEAKSIQDLEEAFRVDKTPQNG